MKLDEMFCEDNPSKVDPTDAEMWKQARGELLGFATHLDRSQSQITADQMRLAVKRSDILGAIFEALGNEHTDKVGELLSLGATGKYPEGKLNDDDEGELKSAIYIEDDKIVINFGKPVKWVALTYDLAGKLIDSLHKFRKKLPTK